MTKASEKNLHRQETDHRELLARQGLRFPAIILQHLRSAHIYCQPTVSIEHQHLGKRYVLRGVESGGAVADLGAYSSFTDEQGNALPPEFVRRHAASIHEFLDSREPQDIAKMAV